MYTQIYSYSGNPNCNSNNYVSAGLIGGLVTFFIVWIANMVAIGIVTRRRGLNPAVYVALAFFCGFTAWACVACSQPQQQVIVVTNGAPMGQMAPNSYPAPNPYGQPSDAPNPYGGDLVKPQ